MANIDIDSLPSQSPLVDTDKVAGSNAAGTSSKWLASTLWTYILSKQHILDATSYSGTTAADKITAAIAALPASGGTVDARGFADASVIDSTITLTPNTTILFGDTAFAVEIGTIFIMDSYTAVMGAGMGRTVFTYGTNEAVDTEPAITTDNGTTYITDITLSGFTVDGNTANQTGPWTASNYDTQLTELKYVDNSTIDSVQITDVLGIGIRFTAARDNNVIKNCRVDATNQDGNSKYGIRVTQTLSGDECTGLRIVDNTVDVVGTGASQIRGIRVDANDDATSDLYDAEISRNRVKLPGDKSGDALGIEVFSGTVAAVPDMRKITISNNFISCTADTGGGSIWGISANYSEDAVIAGNTIEGCTTYAIESFASNSTISGNTCRRSGVILVSAETTGEKITYLENVAITGNTLVDTATSGGNSSAINVYAQPTSTGITGFSITGNVIRLGSGTEVGIKLQSDTTIDDGVISGNTIIAGAAGTRGVHTDGSGGTIDNVVIGSNYFKDFSGHAVYLSSIARVLVGAGNHGEGNAALVFYNAAAAGSSVSFIGAGGEHGFYDAEPVAQQTGVAVSAAGIHAALVSLGLITA